MHLGDAGRVFCLVYSPVVGRDFSWAGLGSGRERTAQASSDTTLQWAAKIRRGRLPRPCFVNTGAIAKEST